MRLHLFRAALLAGAMALPAGAGAFAAAPEAVLDTYADIALAGYEDSLKTAQALRAAIEALTSGRGRCSKRCCGMAARRKRRASASSPWSRPSARR